MVEVEPNLELARLLQDFDARGGVLEFAFFRADVLDDIYSSHRTAAHKFLDDAAVAHFARTATIDYDKYPLAQSYKYKWDPEALQGTQISFNSFWGTDDVAVKQIDARAWSTPNIDGYKTAFFHPPHGLTDGVDGNQTLFAELNRLVFGHDPKSLVIWSWATDCSGYFDSGHEWWGAFLWTLSPPSAQTVTVVGASATD